MAEKTLNVVIKQLTMTSSDWTEQDPVLKLGQIGVVQEDTTKFKIGDGTKKWSELEFSGGSVKSVNGKTGVVTIGKEDVGLDKVDNTSDLEKPISTATQAALDGKVDKNSAVGGDLSGTLPNPTVTNEAIAGKTPAFEVAQTREIIATGESIATIFGKVAKYMTDLGTMAFKNTVTNDDITSVDGTKVTGTVESANKLATSRNISITGDVTASAQPFDGTSDVTLTATLPASGVEANTYTKVTVNEKGIVTQGENLAVSDIPDLTLAKITDAGSAASKNVGTAEGDIPVLGSNGKLNDSVIPAIAINDTFVVGSEGEMTGLTAQVGDVAVRTDLNKSFILKTAGAETVGNWQELLTPSSPVQSVNGKTGAVTLEKVDIGLGNVDNTSDMDKPVSTATQTELGKKAPIESPTFTGAPKSVTPSTESNDTSIATTAFVKSQGFITAETAPVTSVNSKTGDVSLASTDLTDGSHVVLDTDTITIQGIL